jgi:hypothetical protein
MTKFTYKDLSKPASATYRAYIKAKGDIETATEKKQKNMQYTFARFSIAASILDKKDYQMFVSVFYLKDREKNLMSEKAASVLKSFGNKAAGNNKDVNGFEGNADLFVHDNGKISVETLDLWREVFADASLKTWNDFKLFGVEQEEYILSENFQKIKNATVQSIADNVNHPETVEKFANDFEALLKKIQKSDDALDTKAIKQAIKERKEAEANQEIELAKAA